MSLVRALVGLLVVTLALVVQVTFFPHIAWQGIVPNLCLLVVAGAALARAARDRSSLATSVVAEAPDDALGAFVVGAVLGSFGFSWRSEGPEHRPVERIVLTGLEGPDADAELHRALALGGAGWMARRLATTPSNLKDPAWLAGQAERVAEDSGLSVEVWDEQRLAKEGMGGILGVGQASVSPPRLIRLDYTPAKAGRRTPHVVLVGKGITFDSGGLSIKPAESMQTMKRDMTGGAVVIAVLGALADLGCPVRVTGLVAAAENAVSGNALRPGDVVTHYGGRTSEVTNTDAEGRLVLADALAWAVDELKPDAIVDVATLTGAMKVALGQAMGGYFANDDALAEALRVAGLVTHERTELTTPLVGHGVTAGRRRINRGFLSGAVVFIVIGVAVLTRALPAPWLAVGVVAVLGSTALGVVRARHLGHRLTSRSVVIAPPSVARQRIVVDRDGVIGWASRTSLFQRRAGVTTLILATAAGAEHYPLVDVDEETAAGVARDVSPDWIRPFLVP